MDAGALQQLLMQQSSRDQPTTAAVNLQSMAPLLADGATEASLDVQIAQREAALIVPEAAMIYDRNGTYVWRMIDDSSAEKVPVEIGLRADGVVEIVEGIFPGDEIVSAGTHKVMVGKKLRVLGVDGEEGAVETAAPASAPKPGAAS